MLLDGNNISKKLIEIGYEILHYIAIFSFRMIQTRILKEFIFNFVTNIISTHQLESLRDPPQRSSP